MVRLSSTEVGFHCSDRILISVIFFSGKYRKVIQCEWSSGLILTVVCWTTSSFVTVALTPLNEVYQADLIVLVGNFTSFKVPAVPLTLLT